MKPLHIAFIVAALLAATTAALADTSITTREGLAAIANDLGGSYALGADIDLGGTAPAKGLRRLQMTLAVPTRSARTSTSAARTGRPSARPRRRSPARSTATATPSTTSSARTACRAPTIAGSSAAQAARQSKASPSRERSRARSTSAVSLDVSRAERSSATAVRRSRSRRPTPTPEDWSGRVPAAARSIESSTAVRTASSAVPAWRAASSATSMPRP